MSRAAALPAIPNLVEALGEGLFAIDTGFVRPLFDASHLVTSNGRGAFVDVGTNASIPRLLAALEPQGLRPSDVDYVILTHVHLDHAGGAGLLLQALPSARLVVHPRGARHMIDPRALVAGAAGVYGVAAVAETYGQLVPVPEERIVLAPDGFVLEVGGRPLEFLDTPGHARHHVCVWDAASRSFFTGDTFGLSYRELSSSRGPFILPTTTPVQFEPEAMKGSIDRLLARNPQAMLLTHYSRVTGVERLAADLHAQIDALCALARTADARDDRHAWLERAVEDDLVGRALDHGSALSREKIAELLCPDVRLNTQGLEAWLDRPRRKQEAQ